MTVRLSVKGDSELRANLLRLSDLKKADINKAMAEALEPMRAAAEQNARLHRSKGTPKGGHLDEGIVAQEMRQKSSRTRRVWWVTFIRRARKIAHLVEFGTKPHEQPGRGHRHPGSAPRPFFRPAFDAHSEEVLAELATSIRAALFRGVK